MSKSINTPTPSLIILFDGTCNLCNSSVQFIIKHNSKNNCRFASLQSHTGTALLQQYNLQQPALKSIVLIQDQQAYTQSTAVLKIAKQLNSLWSFGYYCIIIPPFIRNAIYSFIANHRYQWFGKQKECMMPTKELRSRFLE